MTPRAAVLGVSRTDLVGRAQLVLVVFLGGKMR